MIFDALMSFIVVLSKALTALFITYTPPNTFALTLLSAASSIIPISEVFTFFGWMLTYAVATGQYLLLRWVVRLLRGA